MTPGAKPTWTPNQEIGADLLGETIDGRYQIVRRLAKGGMAQVFLAKDRTRKCHVAIKILHHAGKAARRRFELEAQVLSNVQCEHIVRAIAFGETADGQPYLALEHLEGETLAQRLAAGPLPWREVARFGVQIATGLHALHVAGIVHRDLKPDNIVIAIGADRAVAKLIDLGLASVGVPFHEVQAARFASQVTERHKTQLGRLIGTPEYLPPEAGTCDAAPTLDVFSLGTTLYQLCTQLLPRMTGARSIQEVIPNSDAPEELSRLIRAAIEPDACDRLSSADHLRRGLEAILDAHPENPRTRRLFGGSYDRLEVLGVGASAIVYRASDRWLSREVALKVLRAAEPDEDDVIRFRRAAKILSAVNHSSIPRILHFGQDGGQHFAVTELCSGVPATEFTRPGMHLRPDDVIAIGRQLAGALAATHAAGVVYRDLHVGNVLIARGEAPKAWIFDFDQGQVSPEFYARLTERWATPPEERVEPKCEKPLRSMDYTAPEVKAGAAFTAASDVFALGLLLYRLLTGLRPFAAWGGGEIIPPRKVCPACPLGLERLLLLMLNPSPGARPMLVTLETAFDDVEAELAEEIEEAEAPPTATALESAAPTTRESTTTAAHPAGSSATTAATPTATAALEPAEPGATPTARAPAEPSATVVATMPAAPAVLSAAATSTPTAASAAVVRVAESLAPAGPTRSTRGAGWLALAITAALMLLFAVVPRDAPREQTSSASEPAVAQAERQASAEPEAAPPPPVASEPAVALAERQGDAEPEAAPPSPVPHVGTAARVSRPESATPPRPHKSSAQTWETRMRAVETNARQCLDEAKVKPRRVAAILSPGEPVEFGNIRSDSPHAQCIRDALDRLKVRSETRRRHTFFDAP